MREGKKKLCVVEECILSSIVSARKIEYHALYKRVKKKHGNFNLNDFSACLSNLVRENYITEDRFRDAMGRVSFVEISPTPFYELLKAAKT
jgi:hypothetical protein